MVHVAPLPPWRRRAQRLVGALLAALGVVVLVIALIALKQPSGHQAALRSASPVSATSQAAASTHAPVSTAPSSATAPAVTSTAPPSTSAATNGAATVALVVLNNTNQTGLAESAAQQFRAGGWTVTSTGNLVNDIISTCAYYDPSNPAAQAAADALQAQFPAIKRVEPKFSGLPAGPIIVVLTTGYS
jgi:hypothetical protein